MGRGILQVESRKPYRSENPQKGRGEETRSPRAWEKIEQKRKCGSTVGCGKATLQGKGGALGGRKGASEALTTPQPKMGRGGGG